MKTRYIVPLRATAFALVCFLTVPLQSAEVTASVRVSSVVGDPSGAVVSLTPIDPVKRQALNETPVHATLLQKNKTFSPHILVVPPESTVDFPNHDPFFHNVFSLFEGKRFDLGLYESGATRSVKFDRTGVSYIFCNIHPQMSAIVISLESPYYAIVGSSGEAKIPNVQPGEYLMQVWAEGLTREQMDQLSRRITINDSPVKLGVLQIPSTETLAQHKNKYGRNYDPTSAAPYEPH